MAMVMKCDVCNGPPGIDENNATITLTGMSAYRTQRTWHLCAGCAGVLWRWLGERRELGERRKEVLDD